MTKIVPTWKKVIIGNELKTGNDFRMAMKNAGCGFVEGSSTILENPQFSVSLERKEIELALISVEELAGLKRFFQKGMTRKAIYDHVQKIGLGYCPLEVGPQLRLQYLDQPANEQLTIVSEPLGNMMFYIEGTIRSGPWLLETNGRPEGLCRLEDNHRLIFMKCF